MKLANGMPVDTEQRRVHIICEVFFAGIAQPKDVANAKLAAQAVAASDDAAGFNLVERREKPSARVLDGDNRFELRTLFRRADALGQHFFGKGFKELDDERSGYMYALAKSIGVYDEVAGFLLVEKRGQQ